MSEPAAQQVQVVRSGGFAGIKQTGEVTLGQDERSAEVESLLDRVDVAALPQHDPQPDRFVYTFHLRGEQVVVGEQQMTPELKRLSELLLER